MDWAFLPIFSRFVEIWKKKNWKIEKLYRSDAISEEKEGKKAGEISVKFAKIWKKWVNGLG